MAQRPPVADDAHDMRGHGVFSVSLREPIAKPASKEVYPSAARVYIVYMSRISLETDAIWLVNRCAPEH